MTTKTISPDFSRKLSKNFDETLKLFTTAASSEFDINPEDLFKKTRKREVVDPRRIVFYLFTHYTIFRHEFVSVEFGMSRTSVLKATTFIRNMVRTDEDFRYRFNKVFETVLEAA